MYPLGSAVVSKYSPQNWSGDHYCLGELNEDGTIKVHGQGLSQFARSSVDCRTSHSAVLQHTPELKRNVCFPQSKNRGGAPHGAEWTCLDLSQDQMEKYMDTGVRVLRGRR